MHVKVTPLNFNPVTERDEPTNNLSYAQLAEGRLRVRLDFLPINEQQHMLLLNLLDKVEARIVARAGTAASPISIELEIGPARA